MNSNLTTRITLALSLAAAVGLAGCYGSSRSSTYYSDDGAAYSTEDVVYVREAPKPPPLIRETITVTPSPQHVWIAGHHEWRHGSWQWEPGHWERPSRETANWAPAHWDHVKGGWVWRHGHWE